LKLTLEQFDDVRDKVLALEQFDDVRDKPLALEQFDDVRDNGAPAKFTTPLVGVRTSEMRMYSGVSSTVLLPGVLGDAWCVAIRGVLGVLGDACAATLLLSS